MKKLIIISLLAGLYSVNATADDEMVSEYWFPNEPGDEVTVNVADEVNNNTYATAENRNHIRRNFLSKRQYRSPAQTQAQNGYQEDDAWQAATDRGEGASVGGEALKSNINMFSRRPYMKRPR